MLINFIKQIIHQHTMYLGKGGSGQKIKDVSDYMGKDRLMKILSHYILGRYGEEMHNSFISELKECKPEKYYVEQKQFFVEQKQKTGVFYMYTQTNGFPACNEWLKCLCLGHDLIIEACGKTTKRVTITDYYKTEDQAQCDYIFTYYDENFVPKPNETRLRGSKAQTSTLECIKPFTDENTTYKGIDRNICVCYDIAKSGTAGGICAL